jgi:hypothetical protein
MLRSVNELFCSPLFKDGFNSLNYLIPRVPLSTTQFFGFEIDLMSDLYTSDLLLELKPSTASWFPSPLYCSFGHTGIELNSYLRDCKNLSSRSCLPRNIWLEFDLRDLVSPSFSSLEPSIFVGPGLGQSFNQVLESTHLIPRIVHQKSYSIPQSITYRLTQLEAVFGTPIQAGFMSSRKNPTFRFVFKVPRLYSVYQLSTDFPEIQFSSINLKLLHSLFIFFDSSCFGIEFDLNGTLLPNFGHELYTPWFNSKFLHESLDFLLDAFPLNQNKINFLRNSISCFRKPSDFIFPPDNGCPFWSPFTQIFTHHFKVGFSASDLSLKAYLGVISPQLTFDSLGSVTVADS